MILHQLLCVLAYCQHFELLCGRRRLSYVGLARRRWWNNRIKVATTKDLNISRKNWWVIFFFSHLEKQGPDKFFLSGVW